MASDQRLELYDVVSPWPVAISLASHLSAGDLLNLARTSTALRAALHDFQPPERLTPNEQSSTVRQSLRIGDHRTSMWERLKRDASFSCASLTHTKDRSDPRPCKYCSRPICEACIVRSSMAKPNEGTFRTRCRYLCKPHWEDGRPTKRRRFPPSEMDEARFVEGWYSPEKGTIDICSCSVLKDGWVCLECKDMQNQEAAGSGSTTCFAEGCLEPLEADKERRKICLWCNKPLPVVRVGGETRQVWNQKIMAAKKEREESRRADLEEYNRNRLKQLRMSRRELRGDKAVEGDPDADKPQFVRHLDTVNYVRFMDRSRAPSGDAIYASKAGKFVYSRQFLSSFRHQCEKTRELRPLFKAATASSAHAFARTNMEKNHHRPHFSALSRKNKWHDLKAHIMQAYVNDGAPLLELQRILYQDYGFLAKESELVAQLHSWGLLRKEGGEGEEAMEDEAMSGLSTPQQHDYKPARMVQEELDRAVAEELQAQLYAEDPEPSDESDDEEESSLPPPGASRLHSDVFESDIDTLFMPNVKDAEPEAVPDEMEATVMDVPTQSTNEEEVDEPPTYSESLGL